ncbi:MAG: 2-amino-4-hydroxy-6-hydroxymethyldihydropteridine diphosphokinase [Acidobacteria bacterium]|nr:2-amino-4-hydroxy-6-hydroxymethyldihydropteridine diphosphokinase [Acidobacteriota bacterium]
MSHAWIGVGSNLGARESYLAAAARSIARLGKVRFASIYETTPVFPRGVPVAGGPFLNTVCRLETSLNVLEVFARLNRIEAQNQRTRAAPYAARTLDLDLLAFDPLCLRRGKPPAVAVSDSSGSRPVPFSLIIPHPRMHVRRFVLVPLVELDPLWKHPLLRRSSGALLAGLAEESAVEWHCAASSLFL